MQANRVSVGFVGWYARDIRLFQRVLSQERDYDLKSGFTSDSCRFTEIGRTISTDDVRPSM